MAYGVLCPTSNQCDETHSVDLVQAPQTVIVPEMIQHQMKFIFSEHVRALILFLTISRASLVVKGDVGVC